MATGELLGCLASLELSAAEWPPMSRFVCSALARHKASSFIVSLELVVLICDTVQIMRGCPLRRRRRRRRSVKPAPASRSLLRALLAAANGAGCKAGGVILAHWLQPCGGGGGGDTHSGAYKWLVCCRLLCFALRLWPRG